MGRLTERKMDYCQLMDCGITCTQKELCDDAAIYNKLRAYEDAEEQGLLVRLIAPNGCAFCRGVRIMAGNFEGSFPLDEEHIEVIQTDDTTDFCFCPMCGRPLVSREEAEAALKEGERTDGCERGESKHED